MREKMPISRGRSWAGVAISPSVLSVIMTASTWLRCRVNSMLGYTSSIQMVDLDCDIH